MTLSSNYLHTCTAQQYSRPRPEPNDLQQQSNSIVNFSISNMLDLPGASSRCAVLEIKTVHGHTRTNCPLPLHCLPSRHRRITMSSPRNREWEAAGRSIRTRRLSRKQKTAQKNYRTSGSSAEALGLEQNSAVSDNYCSTRSYDREQRIIAATPRRGNPHTTARLRAIQT